MAQILKIRKEQYGSRTVYTVSNLTWTIIDRTFYKGSGTLPNDLCECVWA